MPETSTAHSFSLALGIDDEGSLSNADTFDLTRLNSEDINHLESPAETHVYWIVAQSISTALFGNSDERVAGMREFTCVIEPITHLYTLSKRVFWIARPTGSDRLIKRTSRAILEPMPGRIRPSVANAVETNNS